MTVSKAQVRARLALAVAARDVADHARGLIGNLGTAQTSLERIVAARRLRVLAMAVLDHAVLIAAASGEDWAELGQALGLSEGEAFRRYGSTVQMWLSEDPESLNVAVLGGPAEDLHPDEDPEGLAESLVQWHRRHSEPWETQSELTLW